MICDIPNTINFIQYKKYKGPFCIIFYQKDNDENKKLYLFLKSVEEKINDIAIIRFNFNEFKTFFPKEELISPNQILIIEKDRNNRIIENKNYYDILENLQKLSKIKFTQRKHIGGGLTLSVIKRKPWSIHIGALRRSILNKITSIDAEKLYDFPNITALIPSIQRKPKIKEPCQILKLKKTSHLYFPQTFNEMKINGIKNTNINNLYSKYKFIEPVDIQSSEQNIFFHNYSRLQKPSNVKSLSILQKETKFFKLLNNKYFSNKSDQILNKRYDLKLAAKDYEILKYNYKNSQLQINITSAKNDTQEEPIDLSISKRLNN